LFCSYQGLSQCITLHDIPNSAEIEDAYALFRDHFTHSRFNEAFAYWEEVYENAPALNGRINKIYSNGIELYLQKFNKESIRQKKITYARFIIQLYKEGKTCYPNKIIEPIPNEIKEFLEINNKE